MTLKTTKDDWKLIPMKSNMAINWYRDFTTDELCKLKHGYLPKSMDERWFIYEEDNIIYFHRSWTGICVFMLKLRIPSNNHILYINTNEDEYNMKTIHQTINDFYKLVENTINYNSNYEESILDVDNYKKILVVNGDITCADVDCIVNAANNTLLGGGGVDGAIHRAAGPQLLEECKSLNGCKTGEAKITNGYTLPAKYIIHTVGPIYDNSDYESIKKCSHLLADCYKNSLNLAQKYNLHSIAFPCVSTGVYGYPHEKAAYIAINTVNNWLNYNKDYDINIYFYCFLPIDKEIYDQYIEIKFD